jgi:AcrR family transcriptional regulator
MTDAGRQSRRRQIMDAVIDVTASGGLQSATFRTIAEHAGVSVRLVQYYFGDKDQLLADTLAYVGAQVVDRITSQGRQRGPDPSPRDVVASIFEQFLPLDEPRRRAMLVFIALRTAALTDVSLASSNKLGLSQSLLGHIEQQVQQAVDAGQAHANIDPESEAIVLVSALTGLSNMMLAGEISAADARRHLDYAIDGTFLTADL